VKLHQLRLQSVKVLILSQNDPSASCCSRPRRPVFARLCKNSPLCCWSEKIKINYKERLQDGADLVRQNGDPPGAQISKNVAALGNDDIFDSSVLDCLTFGSVNGAIYRLGDFQGPSNLTDAAADFGHSALGGHLVVFAPASGKNILEEDSDWLK
jgi:hypothetical protein